MIRPRFAILRRFALKDLMIVTAVIALALAWRLDRTKVLVVRGEVFIVDPNTRRCAFSSCMAR